MAVKKNNGKLKVGQGAKAPDSRARIFRAALKLFSRKGFAKTGMRELAAEAGVNLAMINYFYGSKVGLLKQILDDYFENLIVIAKQNLAGAGSVEKRLRSFIKATIAYYQANQEELLITITELPRDEPEITEHKAKWAAQLVAIIHENICQGIEVEHGCKISPALIGPPLVGLMSSYFLFKPIMERVQPPGFDRDFMKRYPDVVAEIFLNGINGLVKEAGKSGT